MLIKLDDAIAAMLAAGYEGSQGEAIVGIGDAVEALRALPTVSVSEDMVERVAETIWGVSANTTTSKWADVSADIKIMVYAKSRAALEAALGATVSDGWHPIETAPRDGTLVLLFEPHSEGGFAFVGCNNLGAEWFNNLDMKEQNPTHWKTLGPLPSPPSEQE